MSTTEDTGQRHGAIAEWHLRPQSAKTMSTQQSQQYKKCLEHLKAMEARHCQDIHTWSATCKTFTAALDRFAHETAAPESTTRPSTTAVKKKPRVFPTLM